MIRKQKFFTNHLLIAMPTMDDPNFAHTIACVCEHDEKGALAIIINRPTKIILADVLEQLEIKITNPKVSHIPVLYGGPMHQERGFVIHRSQKGKAWRSSFRLGTLDLEITTSLDILEAIAVNEGPEEMIISLGYAGWAAGQLEEEVVNVWSCVEVTPTISEIFFKTPFENRWLEAMRLMGSPNMLFMSNEVGHA